MKFNLKVHSKPESNSVLTNKNVRSKLLHVLCKVEMSKGHLFFVELNFLFLKDFGRATSSTVMEFIQVEL